MMIICKKCHRLIPGEDYVPHDCLPSVTQKVMTTNAMSQKLAKPPMALIPLVALEEEAKAFGDGAAKHGTHAYKTGSMTATQALSAAVRHIYACLNGEDTTPDSPSQAHHLGCARAELAIALYILKFREALDDRHEKTNE